MKNNESLKAGNVSLGMVAVAVIVAVVLGLVVFGNKSTTNNQSNPNPAQTTVENQSTETTNSQYKDGTYQATGNYTSPGGDEHLDVTISIKDGKIDASEVKSLAERPNSVKFQGIFIANYKPLVVGKNIDEVKLDKVSGSSLSPKGFNDALEKIKAQAQG